MMLEVWALCGARQAAMAKARAGFVGMAPGLVANGLGHGNGTPQSVVENSTAECNAEVKVAPEVPHRVANLNRSINVNPVLGAQLGSGGRASTKSVALGRSNSCTQDM